MHWNLPLSYTFGGRKNRPSFSMLHFLLDKLFFICTVYWIISFLCSEIVEMIFEVALRCNCSFSFLEPPWIVSFLGIWSLLSRINRGFWYVMSCCKIALYMCLCVLRVFLRLLRLLIAERVALRSFLRDFLECIFLLSVAKSISSEHALIRLDIFCVVYFEPYDFAQPI